MSSIWGNNLQVSLFGESHGPVIGMVLHGLPAGYSLDEAELARFMQRRAPGRTPWSTSRKEEDKAEIVSGFYQGKTTGTPLTALIRNTDTHSDDYSDLISRPRPGHADLTGMARYRGFQDPRGSGHFSGRITAGLTFAGAVCAQIIRTRGIRSSAHVLEIDGIGDLAFDSVQPDLQQLDLLADRPFPVLDEAAGRSMIEAVRAAQQDGDSVGGIVETLIIGLPAGLGDPMFDGLESRLASLMFGIPAVKGLDFGAGFAAARMRGSVHNDVPVVRDRSIRFLSNHGGGIQGGISNGMPILFRAVIRPPASIAREQQTINLSRMEADRLAIVGRHDPCIVPRVVPVIEAAAALFALDVLLDAGFGRTD